MIGNELRNNSHGIRLKSCRNITVSNNWIESNSISGIRIAYCDEIVVRNNTCVNNEIGISADYSDDWRRFKGTYDISNNEFIHNETDITIGPPYVLAMVCSLYILFVMPLNVLFIYDYVGRMQAERKRVLQWMIPLITIILCLLILSTWN